MDKEKLITAAMLLRQQITHARTEPIGIFKHPYGVHGYRWASEVSQLVKEHSAKTVLDYGAGKGTLAPKLASTKLQVFNYDPVTFPDMPAPADIVVCTDVLPFVEEETIDNVLAHIHALTLRACFIGIPKHPPEKMVTLPAQQAGLHNWPLAYWQKKLAALWPRHTARIRHAHTPYLIFIGKK